MSLRTINVQYIGSCLRLPKLEREVTAIVTDDGKEYRVERTCHIVRNSRKYVMSDGTELFDDGCSECNEYVGEDDNYCSRCGAKVVGE